MCTTSADHLLRDLHKLSGAAVCTTAMLPGPGHEVRRAVHGDFGSAAPCDQSLTLPGSGKTSGGRGQSEISQSSQDSICRRMMRRKLVQSLWHSLLDLFEQFVASDCHMPEGFAVLTAGSKTVPSCYKHGSAIHKLVSHFADATSYHASYLS